ncbi:MAG TPA: enoyl-CoA hydratase-related protein [Isosphaeraceae bacterium]|jgi:methylglutaconyl-CoA hydratase|nr:enoyl-CoA hydratase-related protein [Isosphaeraceae bacterium]
MGEPTVLRSYRGPIAILTLNRPEKRNALSRALVASLSDALATLAVEAKLRAVVITGAGSAFCAGMDLKEAAALGESHEAEKVAVTDVQALADLLDQLHGLGRPTIAALNGEAVAGGAGLALACDFVVAADTVRFGYPEVKRGMVAAMVMHDLVRQVGDRRARELLLTGALIDAEQAERWGLFNRVVPADRCLDEAVALAQSLVDSAPRALAATKRLLNETGGRPKSLRGAAAISAAVRVSDEAREGMLAFVEKRPPNWVVTSAAPGRPEIAP